MRRYGQGRWTSPEYDVDVCEWLLPFRPDLDAMERDFLRRSFRRRRLARIIERML